MFHNNADMFFKNPMVFPVLPGKFGTLYLLRRDIYTCITSPAIWPGVMAILAGVDLLGKFHQGNDDYSYAGERFKEYIEKYFKVTKEDAEAMYQLRNSLLHSFGLYSKTREKEYNFVLGQDFSSFITYKQPNTYFINVITLHEKFENSIELYKTELDKSNILQDNFTKMFDNYGKIPIG